MHEHDDDEQGYLHGGKHYHRAPSGPLADSEAVYDLDFWAVDFMVKTAEEACPNCGEFHGEGVPVVRLMFKDDKPIIVGLEPHQALRLGNALTTLGIEALLGPETIDPRQVPPQLLSMLGLALDDDGNIVQDDSLDMPDDEDIINDSYPED